MGREIYVLLFISFFAAQGWAQNGEYRNDCTYAKEIVVPYNYSATGDALQKPNLNQTVFYNYREQFSYWYKIFAKEDFKLSFQVKAINDSDEYAVYVYQYNGNDFCEKVYEAKVRELKGSFFTPAKSDPYDLSARAFKAQKENVYYISVLNTSLTNCGHEFYMTCGADTLKVKALHLPCNRTLNTFAVSDFKIDIPKKEAQVPATATNEISLKMPELNVAPEATQLFCSVKHAVKKTAVDARIGIFELSSQENVNVNMCGTGNCTGLIEDGKQYQIKCAAFGFKSVNKTITAAKGKNEVEILLEPYKPGENFVMKTIYFYPNTYALKKEASGELQKLLQFMRDNEALIIEIQGHTNGDNRIARNPAYEKLGEEWNFKGNSKQLSEKRAETIKQFLMANGIPEQRIHAKGYGGKNPIIKDPQNNEEGQMNIRVEISILKS